MSGTEQPTHPPLPQPQLAVVVIGRDEGDRLLRSLQSVEAMSKPEGGIEVVYVDTASGDGSADRVEAQGIRVLRIFPEKPSAAVARDTGWRAVKAPFVLFLDGDSQIEPDFVTRALPRFDDPKVAIVWGRLREAYPHASIYNRMMHAQWICLRTLPEGPCFYGTGIGLVRREALEAVNGFDFRMINGQNTDLGRRMQALGYVVLHLALPMVRHDAEMMSMSQYMHRFFREGYSYARLKEKFGPPSKGQPLFRFEFSTLGGAMMLIGPLVVVVAAVLLRSWLVLAAGVMFFGMSLLRTALHYRKPANGIGEALLFSLHWHIKLIPNFFGDRAYHRDKRLGRERGLMEYRKV